MKKHGLSYLLIFLFCLHTYAQQTVGLFSNTPESFDGYTLFAPNPYTETYLINNCGEKVHSWASQHGPALSVYLLEDGTLLRTGRIQGMGGDAFVEMIDWDSNVIWSYSPSATHGRYHHDVELLPNGNILMLVRDPKTQAELDSVGGTTTRASINSEQVIEIQPDTVNGGATVVWEWKAWDHLIQNVDSTKPGFGVVGQHPERVDINYVSHENGNWLHTNGIDYNATFDQIIISARTYNEFWIIDHSTTTSEAADTTGGKYGKGGDLLYRWGNPESYDQGTPADRKLFLQHDAHWIPDSLQDAGKIILFNNQNTTPLGRSYSTINIVDLPVDANGFYTYNSGAYAPADYDWTYLAPDTISFFSTNLSGVQRLPNGNTLICSGAGGIFFEVDDKADIVWKYVNPAGPMGPVTQNTIPSNGSVFRCTRYPREYPAFAGKNLMPQGYIESGSNFTCDLYTVGIESLPMKNHLQLYPNPAQDHFTLSRMENTRGDLHISCYTMSGQQVQEKTLQAGTDEVEIDIRSWSHGIYLVKVSNGREIWTDKVVKTK